MKFSKVKTLIVPFIITLVFTTISCENFMSRKPVSEATPDDYFKNDSQLGSYTIDMYDDAFSLPAAGMSGYNVDTDNIAGLDYSDIYVPGEWKVPEDGGAWSFDNIAECNYFFEKVLPLWKSNKIQGSNVKHYIGEMYFLRAYIYFQKLKTLGDFPIVKSTLSVDNKQKLISASKRNPRNEVARFIISDLDSAATLMNNNSPDGNKNRLSKKVALIMKSRVALYEATWLKYFQGTAFVPNGPGWPGKNKEYNSDYQYPTGGIKQEIQFFLSEAMKSSKSVAESVPLTPNNMTEQNAQKPQEFAEASMNNPYYNMFSAEDMSTFSSIIFWRDFDISLEITNDKAVALQTGNRGRGLTRGMVDGFLMKNGLPIYASGSGYAGDDSISTVRKDRDGRLWLFLKEPGQINILIPSASSTHANPVEGYPNITNNTVNKAYPTGYSSRKGLNYDAKHTKGNYFSSIGFRIFRAAEAYLNYIEASYEKNRTLDGTAVKYWKKIRERAGVDSDFRNTIAATNLLKEAKNDWGAYSAGNLVDKTLYNIRRERRSEFMNGNLRMMDLHRWRAMDQMINKPYHVEGFKLWGPMQNWYSDDILKYGIGDKSTVSAPSQSVYLRPFEKTPSSLVYNGYKWTMAHYLSPIAFTHFLNTSENNDVETSPIYQNPGWPTSANQPPLESQ